MCEHFTDNIRQHHNDLLTKKHSYGVCNFQLLKTEAAIVISHDFQWLMVGDVTYCGVV